MKQRTIILGIGALIALAVSGVYGMRLYGKSCKAVFRMMNGWGGTSVSSVRYTFLKKAVGWT